MDFWNSYRFLPFFMAWVTVLDLLEVQSSVLLFGLLLPTFLPDVENLSISCSLQTASIFKTTLSSIKVVHVACKCGAWHCIVLWLSYGRSGVWEESAHVPYIAEARKQAAHILWTPQILQQTQREGLKWTVWSQATDLMLSSYNVKVAVEN